MILSEKEVLVAQLCLTLWQPHGLQLVRLLSVKLSRQEYWSGLLFPFQGDLPNQDQTWLSHIADRFFTV